MGVWVMWDRWLFIYFRGRNIGWSVLVVGVKEQRRSIGHHFWWSQGHVPVTGQKRFTALNETPIAGNEHRIEKWNVPMPTTQSGLFTFFSVVWRWIQGGWVASGDGWIPFPGHFQLVTLRARKLIKMLSVSSGSPSPGPEARLNPRYADRGGGSLAPKLTLS